MIGLGIIGFIVTITLLVIGFFGGEQTLQNIYPEHTDIIHFIAEMIRIAFWIVLAMIAIVFGITFIAWYRNS